MFIQNMYGLYSCKKENRFKVMRLIDTTEQTLVNNDQHTLNTQEQKKKPGEIVKEMESLMIQRHFMGRYFWFSFKQMCINLWLITWMITEVFQTSEASWKALQSHTIVEIVLSDLNPLSSNELDQPFTVWLLKRAAAT